jgi:hypothetical protein
MTSAFPSPQPPASHPDQLRTILDHLADVVHAFLYIGDVANEEMHTEVDRAFGALAAAGVPSEHALAVIKGIVRRVQSGGSIRALDDEAGHWLMSNLVTWMIASYYGSGAGAGRA